MPDGVVHKRLQARGHGVGSGCDAQSSLRLDVAKGELAVQVCLKPLREHIVLSVLVHISFTFHRLMPFPVLGNGRHGRVENQAEGKEASPCHERVSHQLAPPGKVSRRGADSGDAVGAGEGIVDVPPLGDETEGLGE